MSPETIRAKIAAQRAELDRLGVASLELFGSAARREHRPGGDVDLLVRFEGAATVDRYMHTKLLLEDVLGCQVDLLTDAALRAALRPYVERDLLRVA